MQRKIQRFLFAVGLSAALAAGLGPATAKADEAARAPDLKAYDFEDELVQGDLVNPDGEVLLVRRRGTRESLIRPRTEYVSELLQSAQDL